MDALLQDLTSTPCDNNNNQLLSGQLAASDLSDLFSCDLSTCESTLDTYMPTLQATSLHRGAAEFRCVSMETSVEQNLMNADLQINAKAAQSGTESGAVNTRHRELEIYDPSMNKLSDIRLKLHPDDIFMTLIAFLDKTANSFKLHERKFKINAVYITEDDRLDVKFAISQASEEEFVLEINSKKG
eukprot:CAMPEP_0115016668 /NCGR_PEP_ID=MMETSP0216-20121206/27595_1 /TAXON_ID=223996 /ORGANISM="Protocruzia adherens, Strain Boccale" /LENGTH=185 /DNA_ID=CAMNT_0002387211 /DNA_START=1036 /DNA_END=1593 /DNA_ORIENTATION=-